jgi:multicomponent Na+:H+ antiporter subunit F
VTLPTLALALLAVGAVIVGARTVLGPTVADRIVGVDTLLIIVIGLIAITTGRTGSSLFIDVALVISLLAFVGTSIAARFIEQRGA